MVAVVGDLVIELIGRRVQLEHPLQSPARFIKQVRDAVGLRLAEGVYFVREDRGFLTRLQPTGSAFRL